MFSGQSFPAAVAPLWALPQFGMFQVLLLGIVFGYQKVCDWGDWGEVGVIVCRDRSVVLGNGRPLCLNGRLAALAIAA